MPQLRSALTNIAPTTKLPGEHGSEQESGVSIADRREKESGASAEDPMLLALSSRRHPAVVEMRIFGTILTDTIVDVGSGVNALPEDTWKRLGQPTLWPPTFQLLMEDQNKIKPLGVLMAQPMTIGTQSFLLNFIVIPLKRRGYDAILGRGWLVQARVKHDWKKNTPSMERGGRRFIIDLHTQMVGKEAASSDSEGESENDDEEKKRMEPDEEGVLRLEGGSDEDDLDLLNGLFHWQMEDYELFPSCNMLRVDKGEKEEGNQYPKEYREAEEGKAITTKAEGKNIRYKPKKRKDSTVRPHRKEMLRRTTNIAESCRQQGRHIIWSAQETKRKCLIKAVVLRSDGSKIKNTVIDNKEWQPTEFIVPSVRNKLGDMENLRERSCNLNKLDE